MGGVVREREREKKKKRNPWIFLSGESQHMWSSPLGRKIGTHLLGILYVLFPGQVLTA